MTSLRAAYLWVRRRAAGEEGSAAVEFVYLAVLLMIPLIYLMRRMIDSWLGSDLAESLKREAARD